MTHRPTRKISNYTLVLGVDPDTLIRLSKISDRIDFEAIVHVAFEKMIYLQSMAFVYDFLYDALVFNKIDDYIQPLMRQALAVSSYLDEVFNYIVIDITYDDPRNYELLETVVDLMSGSIMLRFEVL
jgi:hypothetical protein